MISRPEIHPTRDGWRIVAVIGGHQCTSPTFTTRAEVERAAEELVLRHQVSEWAAANCHPFADSVDLAVIRAVHAVLVEHGQIEPATEPEYPRPSNLLSANPLASR